MTRLRTFALLAVAAAALSACSMEGSEQAEAGELITITHTGKGTVYWQ